MVGGAGGAGVAVGAMGTLETFEVFGAIELFCVVKELLGSLLPYVESWESDPVASAGSPLLCLSLDELKTFHLERFSFISPCIVK